MRSGKHVNPVTGFDLKENDYSSNLFTAESRNIDNLGSRVNINHNSSSLPISPS